MAADLIKIVNNLRDDLKALYLQSPMAVWDLPIVAFSRKTGGVALLDGIKNDQHVVDWVTTHMQKDIESIVVGRMVAKHSPVLDGEGKPVIKEKAIMVMGRQLNGNRSYVSITPCFEHRDYRSDQFAEKQNKTFDPTLAAPDLTRNMVDEETNQVFGRMQAKFGKEQIYDSRQGDQFMVDPIIEGLFPTPRGIEEKIAAAQDLNAIDEAAIKKIKKIL